jgi:tetratricopeptide (TPR) repeat protein
MGAKAYLQNRGGVRAWAAPLAVFGIALALRLLHIHAIENNPFFSHPIVDAWDYHKDALHMVETGDWIGNRAFFQAPLTSYFLAAIYRFTGISLMWPRIVQALLGSMTAAGVFILGRRLFSEKAAYIAGIITAVYPLFIFFDGELLAPTITLFLDVLFLLALFAAAARKALWRWAVPGLLFGLRALATTNNLATVPVFWIWILISGRSGGPPGMRRLAAVAVFTLGITAAIAPVTIRNYVLQREFVLVSSNAGINFYLGNTGDYEAKVSMRPGLDWDDFVNKHVRAGRRVGPEMSGYFFEQSLKYIRENPAEYLRLSAYKTYLFLRGDEVMRNQEIYAFREYSPVLRVLMWKVGIPGGPGLAVPFGLLLPLAWPGFLLAFKLRRGNAILLAAYAAAYSLSVIAFFVTARYRLPVVIPLTLLMAYGWSEFRRWWRPANMRAAALSGILAIGILCNWNLGPMPHEMNPDAYHSLATTLASQGDLAGAEIYFKKALEADPDDAAAWVNLGLSVYQERGMDKQAEACYRRALEVRPGYAPAVYNLGLLAQLENRPAQAESLYMEAAALDPLMSGPYVNIASMALGRGDYEKAYRFYREAHLRNPEDPRALAGLGVAAYEIHGLREAMVFFDEAVKADPAFPDTYFNLALVYAKSGKPGEAAGYARKLIELDPRDNQAYVIYADQMRAAGRIEEARKFLEGAAGRNPDLPGPRQALSRLNR